MRYDAGEVITAMVTPFDEKREIDYEKATMMPNVILDLTDETKTITEAIAECEANRQKVMPWYRKIVKRIKRLF